MLVPVLSHWQLALINSQISKAKTGPLKGKALIQDPMKGIVKAHVAILEWHMQSRKFGMTAAKLELLQQKSVEVLESLVSTLPTLYVCPVENVFSRVPLIPCYLNGNTANTIPHKYRSRISREAAADSRPDSGTGSRLFEVNVLSA